MLEPNAEVAALKARIAELEQQLAKAQTGVIARGGLLEELVSRAYDAAIQIDAKGMVREYSLGAQPLFGYSPSEVLGKPLDVLLPERFRAMHSRLIAAFLQSTDEARPMGGGLRVVYGLHKDGSEFPVEAIITKELNHSRTRCSVFLRKVDLAASSSLQYQRIQNLQAWFMQVREQVEQAVDPSTLCPSLCQMLVHEAGYQMAWVGPITQQPSHFTGAVWQQGVHSAEVLAALQQPQLWEQLAQGKQVVLPNQPGVWAIKIPLFEQKSLIILASEGFDRAEPQWISYFCSNVMEARSTAAEREQRMQVQASLQILDKRFSQLFEQAAVGMCVCDQQARFLRANRKFCEITGYTEAELLQLTFAHITHPDDLDADLNQVKRLEAGEINSYDLEKRYICKDGRVIWISLSVFALPQEINGPMEMVGVVQDITERKLSEEALRRSETQLNQAQKVARMGSWSVDLTNQQHDWSPQLFELLGIATHSPVQDELYIQAVHPDDRKKVHEAWDAMLLGQPYNLEYRVVVQGQVRWVHDQASVELNDQGQMVRGVGFVQDITERRQVEEALRRSEMQLKDAQAVAHIGSWFCNVVAQTTEWSQETYRIFGVREGTPITLDGFFASVWPEDLEHVQAAWQAALQGEQPYNIEHRIVVNGQVRWVHERAEVRFDEQGQAIEAIGTTQDITERRQVEEALRRSEMQLNEAQAVAHIGSWIYNPRTGTAECSQEIYRLLSLPYNSTNVFAELLQQAHPEDRERAQAALQAALRGEQPYDIEYRIVVNGKVRWVHERANIRFDEQGQAIEAIGTTQDITERKEVEEALRLSATMLKQAQRVSQIGSWRYDYRTDRYDMPNETLQLLGYPPGTVLGYADIQQTIHPEEKAVVEAAWKRTYLGEPYEVVRQVIENGQTKRWIHARAEIICNEKGEPIEAIGATQDVTKWRQAEQALRESEARYRLLADYSTDVIWVLDTASMKFTYVSPSVEKLRGYTVDEVMAQPMSQVMTPQSLEAVNQQLPLRLQEYLSGNLSAVSHTDEVEQYCKDGSTVWTEVVTTFLTNLDGSVSVLGVSRDISERKRSEEALRRSERVLRQAQNVAHIGSWFYDLRNDTAEWSQEALNTFGIPYGSSNIFAQFLERVHPEDREQVQAAWQAALRGEQPYNIEHRIVVNGEVRWVHERAEFYGDGVDGPTYAIGTTQDITERKQAEEALRTSERNLKKAQVVAKLGSWELDLVSGQLHWSDETYLIFGISHTDPQFYQTFLNRVHPEDRVRVDEAWQAALAGAPYNIEHRIVVNDQTKWVHEQAELMFNDQGQPIRGVGVVQDITERKQMEDELRASEERFRKMLEAPGLLAVLFNLQGQMQFVNDFACQAVGYSRQELLGHGWSRLGMLGSEALADFNDNLRRQKLDVLWQHQLRTKDGATKHVRWVPSLLLDAAGQPASVAAVGFDITEQFAAQEALRISETRYRALYNTARDAIFIADPQTGIIQDANLPAQVLMGRPLESFIGKHQAELHPPDIEAQVRQAFGFLVNNEGAFDTQTEILRADGVRVPVEIRSNSFIDGNGRRMLFGFFRNITEQLKAQAQLKASEERYRTLAEAAPDMIYIINDAQELEYVNTAAAQMAGGIPSQMVGKRLQEVVPVPAPQMQAALDKALAYGKQGYVEEALDTPAGTVWLGTSFTPLHLEAGKAKSVLAISRNTTEQHLIQDELRSLAQQLEQRVEERTQQLQRSEARLNYLLDNAPVAIFTFDLQSNRTTYVARSIERIVGVAVDAGGGTVFDPSELVHPQDVPKLAHFLQQCNPHSVTTLELRIKWPVGEWRWFRCGAIVLVAVSGKPELVGFVMDIHQERMAQEALVQASQELEAANRGLEQASRMKDEFLAAMSHELRTPLTGILGLSDVMEQGVYGELNPKQTQAIGTIKQSGTHLLNLINDILDISKIEAGKLELSFSPVEIDELCRSSLQMVSQLAASKEVGVSLESNAFGYSLNADARRLKQVLVNLLSNAVKFTPEGGQVGLRVQINKAHSQVSFAVWDTGIGISPEDQSKLFKPFVQIDSRLSRNYAGTGLGLSLVKRLTEMHGGQVTLQSQPGQGSVFTVTLPLAATAVVAAPQTLKSLQRVFVVEDNTIDNETVSRFCEQMGLQSKSFVQVKGALEEIAHYQPDLVVLDLYLPDGSGWDLLQALKAHTATAHIPVVIVSVEDNEPKAKALGAAGYLLKPANSTNLRALLHKIGFSTEVLKVPSKSQNPRLLIAEDNPVTLDMLHDYLQAKGFEVYAAKDGFAALEVFKELQPNLVLMDVQMPGMDGLETMRKIRALEQGQKVPIIAVTALAMPHDRDRCFAAGASAYLSKPLDLQLLVQEINTLLSLKEGGSGNHSSAGH